MPLVSRTRTPPGGRRGVTGVRDAEPGGGLPGYSGAGLTRGRGGFLNLSDGGRSATVMVGPVRGPDHLEIIRRFHFYHVPVSAIAASRTAVDYIAFYEGRSRFKGETGLIREYAEVLKVTRVRRGDLPGITWPGRQGDDAPYYRFDLGPPLPLPRPITNPDHLRVVFRFPDLARFQDAAMIRGLRAPASAKPRMGRKS